MPLVTDTTEETPEQKLAKEARARLAEYARATYMAYSNLMTYRHNNPHGVTAAQFDKAMGADLKDFTYVLGAMRRVLLKLSPDYKAQIAELKPKRKGKK